MTTPRRKLVAIDDPLAVRRPMAEPRRPARGEASRTAALYVQLPTLQSASLRRAAFELRVHKRVLVAALIDAYVDATSEDGLELLRALISRAPRTRLAGDRHYHRHSWPGAARNPR